MDGPLELEPLQNSLKNRLAPVKFGARSGTAPSGDFSRLKTIRNYSALSNSPGNTAKLSHRECGDDKLI